MKSILFFLLLPSLISSSLFAQELQFEKLPDLVFEEPVDLVSTYVEGDDRLFVLEKTGKVFIIEDPDIDQPIAYETPFLDLSTTVNDDFEGGLLGLAFHPDYADNGFFFVNYTFDDSSNDNKFTTKISRFHVNANSPNVADIDSEVEFLKIAQPKKNHNGGDIAFGPDGYLYIPTGDGGGAGDIYENGQNKQSMHGKVLRIDINTIPYSIPEDNPFVEDDETLDEIWSLGWRNPWKVSFDRETGDFWAADVGQNEIEEIDMEPAGTEGGRNYGWNCFEGSQAYDPTLCDDDMIHTPPVFQYDQSQGWKSVTGGYVYRGSRHTDLYGKYIFTDYEDSRVFWLTTEIAENSFETVRYDYSGPDLPFRITTFGESSKGELYFATLDHGEIWRIFTSVVNKTVESEKVAIQIEPNPSTDFIQIEYLDKDIQSIQLISTSGKTFQLNALSDNRFDIQSIPSGLYYIQIDLDGRFVQAPFSKL